MGKYWKKWTEEEIEKLREIYPKMPLLECVNELNRTAYAITSKAHHMKIKAIMVYG